MENDGQWSVGGKSKKKNDSSHCSISFAEVRVKTVAETLRFISNSSIRIVSNQYGSYLH